MLKLVIVDCGAGNLHSVEKSFRHVVKQTGSHEIGIAETSDDLANADHIVLPGVGAFADCMQGLASRDGLGEALEMHVLKHGKPFLGICVGMQMLVNLSHEHGKHPGLGWLDGEVHSLKHLLDNEHNTMTATTHSLKIPHMGWNNLRLVQSSHPLLKHITPGDHVYFVHSYAANLKDTTDIIAEAEYGISIPAMIGRDNIVGTQFHPEKSQDAGLTLIKNFLNWRP